MSQASKDFALITGAPSGIGAIYADRLAKRGYDLIRMARRFNRLRTLADKIAGETERKVEVVAAITKWRTAAEGSLSAIRRYIGHSELGSQSNQTSSFPEKPIN